MGNLSRVFGIGNNILCAFVNPFVVALPKLRVPILYILLSVQKGADEGEFPVNNCPHLCILFPQIQIARHRQTEFMSAYSS